MPRKGICLSRQLSQPFPFSLITDAVSITDQLSNQLLLYRFYPLQNFLKGSWLWLIVSNIHPLYDSCTRIDRSTRSAPSTQWQQSLAAAGYFIGQIIFSLRGRPSWRTFGYQIRGVEKRGVKGRNTSEFTTSWVQEIKSKRETAQSLSVEHLSNLCRNGRVSQTSYVTDWCYRESPSLQFPQQMAWHRRAESWRE